MDVYSELVESLENCDAVCSDCAVSSLDEEDNKAMSDCIKLSLDCADVCHLALRLLARDSSYVVSAVKLCMNMCDECATEYERHEHDQSRLCYQACRQCETHCRNYLEQAAEPESI